MVRVEAREGLDQAQPRHLDEIVEGLPAIHEASSHVARDPEVILDELVAQGDVTGIPVQREPFIGRAGFGHGLSSRFW